MKVRWSKTDVLPLSYTANHKKFNHSDYNKMLIYDANKDTTHTSAVNEYVN